MSNDKTAMLPLSLMVCLCWLIFIYHPPIHPFIHPLLLKITQDGLDKLLQLFELWFVSIYIRIIPGALSKCGFLSSTTNPLNLDSLADRA